MAVVFVPNPVAQSVVDRLATNHEVVLGYGDDPRTWEDIEQDIEAVLVRGDNITAERISRAPKLKIVARHGVGTNNVALDTAAERGIWVTTTPGANARAVAEHVFALLLANARRVIPAGANTASGRWGEDRAALNGTELYGKTMFLVGGGGITRLVVPIAKGFGMEVVVFDPYLPQEAADGMGVELVSELADGMVRADVVSVHVPLTPETHGMIGADELALLRPGAFVINTSRGGIIDEASLVASLKDGSLAGVSLDVIEAEYVDMMDPLPHTTLEFGTANLIVTPHIGGQTQEALEAVGVLAVESVETALNGERPPRALDLNYRFAGE